MVRALGHQIARAGLPVPVRQGQIRIRPGLLRPGEMADPDPGAPTVLKLYLYMHEQHKEEPQKSISVTDSVHHAYCLAVHTVCTIC